jgi:hypothetical protein
MVPDLLKPPRRSVNIGKGKGDFPERVVWPLKSFAMREI